MDDDTQSILGSSIATFPVEDEEVVLVNSENDARVVITSEEANDEKLILNGVNVLESCTACRKPVRPVVHQVGMRRISKQGWCKKKSGNLRHGDAAYCSCLPSNNGDPVNLLAYDCECDPPQWTPKKKVDDRERARKKRKNKAGKEVYVQLGAFKTKLYAERLKEKMDGEDLISFIVKDESVWPPWHKVRIGPFYESGYNDALKRLKELNHQDYFVVP